MVNFLKSTRLYILISTVVIGLGLFSIVKWGYIYSIDFVGGTNLEYQIGKKADISEIKKIFRENNISLTELNVKENIISAKSKAINDNQENLLIKNLEKTFKTKITVLKSETVGPVLGAETINKTVIASVLAILGILIYMTFAFKGFNFAFAAVLALIHDFLVVIGTYSLMSHFFHAEVDTLFVTAILTTMSFSVHDTIIIFDKIREYIKHEGKGEINYYANRALTETLVRSLNNSMTIIFMLLALSLLGGSSTRFFVLTLLIGTITGTYSSPFIATPILVWLEKRKK